MKLQVKQKIFKKNRENANIFLDIIRQMVYIIIPNCEIHSQKQYQTIRNERGFIMKYRKMSIEQLFKAYQFENDRINKDDANITKALIVKEVYRRVKSSFNMLDDATTEEQAIKIAKQFNEF